MNEPSPASSAGPEPTPEAVAEFLAAHPEFLADHPALVERIAGSGAADVASLVTRQLARLRDENEALRTQIRELLDNARRNDALFAELRTWIRGVLGCDTGTALVELTALALERDFGADAAVLVLEADGPGPHEGPGLRSVRTRGEDGDLAHLLRPGQVVCGVLRPAELERLFGDRARDLASAVVVGLDHPQVRGAMVAAHRDPAHFTPGMDTLFVRFMADVLCRALARYGTSPGTP